MEGDEENSQGKGNSVVDDGGKSESENQVVDDGGKYESENQEVGQEPVINAEPGSSSSAPQHDVHDSNPEKKKDSAYFTDKRAHLEPGLELSRDCKDEDWGKDIEALQQCYEMGGDENSLIHHQSSPFQKVRGDLEGRVLNGYAATTQPVNGGDNPHAAHEISDKDQSVNIDHHLDGSEDLFGEFGLDGISECLDLMAGDIDPNFDFGKVLDDVLDNYSKCGVSDFAIPYSEVLQRISNLQHDDDSNPEKKKGSAYSTEMRAHLEPKLKLLRDCKDAVEGFEELIEALQQCYELGDDENSLIQHPSPSFLKVSAELDGNLHSLKVSIDNKKRSEQDYRGLDIGEHPEPSVISWLEDLKKSIDLENEEILALKQQVEMGCNLIVQYNANNAGNSKEFEVQLETTSAAAEEGIGGNYMKNIEEFDWLYVFSEAHSDGLGKYDVNIDFGPTMDSSMKVFNGGNPVPWPDTDLKEESKKGKKRKRQIPPAAPEPELPQIIRDTIIELGGTNPEIVWLNEKVLKPTDIDRKQSRVILPPSQFLSDVFGAQEEDNKIEVSVTVVDPVGETSKMNFKKRRSEIPYVLSGGWSKFVKKFNIVEALTSKLQLWFFRGKDSGNPCFAINLITEGTNTVEGPNNAVNAYAIHVPGVDANRIGSNVGSEMIVANRGGQEQSDGVNAAELPNASNELDNANNAAQGDAAAAESANSAEALFGSGPNMNLQEVTVDNDGGDEIEENRITITILKPDGESPANKTLHNSENGVQSFSGSTGS